MKRLFIALLSILAFAVVSPLAYAGGHHSKHDDHSKNKDKSHHHGDGRDDDDDDEDDDDDHCPVSIPVPTPSTPPTQTAATFLGILPAVPSSTSISSSLGSVSQFYSAAAWATVVSNRNSHGAIVSEAQTSTGTQTNILGVTGTFNMVYYVVRFADGSVMNETVAMQLGADGVWRVAYYALETPGIADPLGGMVE